MIRTEYRAIERAPNSVQRSFSKFSSGPSVTPRANTCPALSVLGNHESPRKASPVVNSQSSVNTSCSWVTTGPCTRKWMSCTGFGGWRWRQGPTRIFMPPVNPTRPSTTRIFRWVRILIVIRCHKANDGRNRAYFTPSRRSMGRMVGHEYRVPVASISTRTSTPRRAASPSACAKAVPTSS